MISLYAYSIMAVKMIYASTEIYSVAGVCIAHSEQEAKGYALDQCHKTYPSAEKYTQHTISVCLVPNELIEKVSSQ
jgi:hypothetical protein